MVKIRQIILAAALATVMVGMSVQHAHADDADIPTTHDEWLEWYLKTPQDHPHDELYRQTFLAEIEFSNELPYTEERGTQPYLMALLITHDRLNDTYAESNEAVKLHHDWLVKWHSTDQHGLESIGTMLDDMIGSDNIHHLRTLMAVNDEAAKAGHVDPDLFGSDPHFWWHQIDLFECTLADDPQPCIDAEKTAYLEWKPLTAEEYERLNSNGTDTDDITSADGAAVGVSDEEEIITTSVRSSLNIKAWYYCPTDDNPRKKCTYHGPTSTGYGERSSSAPSPARHVGGDPKVGYDARIRLSGPSGALHHSSAIAGEVIHPDHGCVRTGYGTTAAYAKCNGWNPPGRDHLFESYAAGRVNGHFN